MLTKEQEVEIGVLAKQGLSQRAIAKLTGYSRNTVKRYLEGDPDAGRYRPRPAVAGKITPFEDYLRARVAAAAPDWIPAVVLHREITERGFNGAYETTKRFLRTLKRTKALKTARGALAAGLTTPVVPIVDAAVVRSRERRRPPREWRSRPPRLSNTMRRQ